MPVTVQYVKRDQDACPCREQVLPISSPLSFPLAPHWTASIPGGFSLQCFSEKKRAVSNCSDFPFHSTGTKNITGFLQPSPYQERRGMPSFTAIYKPGKKTTRKQQENNNNHNNNNHNNKNTKALPYQWLRSLSGGFPFSSPLCFGQGKAVSDCSCTERLRKHQGSSSLFLCYKRFFRPLFIFNFLNAFIYF